MSKLPKPQTPQGEWWTIGETAGFLKRSPAFIRKLFKEGKLAGKQPGSGPNAHILISAVSVDKFMESK
jgi:hypothetical protein